MRKSYFAAYSRYFVLCLSALLVLSCKKNKSDDPSGNNARYKITYSGSHFLHDSIRFVGDPVSFHSDIPAGTKIQWLFGDGTSSTDTAPTHTYQEIGDYFVVAVINGDTGNLLKKNPEVYISLNKHAKASDLSKLHDLRYWFGIQDSLTYVNSSSIVDTVSVFEDTFGVTVVNYTTIVVKGDTLKGVFDVEGVREYYSFYKPFSQFSWQWLHYYYEKDSIIYCHHPYKGGHNSGTSKLPSWPFGITTSYVTHK